MISIQYTTVWIIKFTLFVVDSKVLYSLDVLTGKWSAIDVYSDSETFYRHYNSHFDPEENSIYIFGGYGQYTYHNEIRRLDLNKNEWKDLTFDNDDILSPVPGGSWFTE